MTTVFTNYNDQEYPEYSSLDNCCIELQNQSNRTKNQVAVLNTLIYLNKNKKLTSQTYYRVVNLLRSSRFIAWGKEGGVISIDGLIEQMNPLDLKVAKNKTRIKDALKWLGLLYPSKEMKNKNMSVLFALKDLFTPDEVRILDCYLEQKRDESTGNKTVDELSPNHTNPSNTNEELKKNEKIPVQRDAHINGNWNSSLVSKRGITDKKDEFTWTKEALKHNFARKLKAVIDPSKNKKQLGGLIGALWQLDPKGGFAASKNDEIAQAQICVDNIKKLNEQTIEIDSVKWGLGDAVMSIAEQYQGVGGRKKGSYGYTRDIEILALSLGVVPEAQQKRSFRVNNFTRINSL